MIDIRDFDNYICSYNVDIYKELDSVGMSLFTHFMVTKAHLDPMEHLPYYIATKYEYGNNRVKYLLHNMCDDYPNIYIQVVNYPNGNFSYTFGVSN